MAHCAQHILTESTRTDGNSSLYLKKLTLLRGILVLQMVLVCTWFAVVYGLILLRGNPCKELMNIQLVPPSSLNNHIFFFLDFRLQYVGVLIRVHNTYLVLVSGNFFSSS